MKLTKIAVTLAVTASSVVLGTNTASAHPSPCAPQSVAHRGGKEVYVENTRKAFTYASSKGVRALELDVQFTKHATPMVLHDPTVDRVTNGSGEIAKMGYSQVRSYRTADGQVIPSLYEVLADNRRYGVTYFVELKTAPPNWEKFDWRFDALNVKSKTVITSFDKNVLREAKARGYKTGLIEYTSTSSTSEIKSLGNYYFKFHGSATPARLEQWSDAGISTYVWFPGSPRDWQKFAGDSRVGGVVTNSPVRYHEWAHSKC